MDAENDIAGTAGELAGAVPGMARAWGAFWALGDEGRWRVARLLSAEGALSVAEVGDRLGLAPLTASRYLKALWVAGLVGRVAPAEDGRQRVYRLTEVGAGLVQAGVLLEG